MCRFKRELPRATEELRHVIRAVASDDVAFTRGDISWEEFQRVEEARKKLQEGLEILHSISFNSPVAGAVL